MQRGRNRERRDGALMAARPSRAGEESRNKETGIGLFPA
jgi:hypothetical protein